MMINRMITKKNAVSNLIGLIIAAIFLYLALTPPSLFNLIPFAIHQALISDGFIKESTFIIIFDIAFAFLIFYLISKLGQKLIE